MKDVYIIDSFSHHSFHEVFTASFINVCIYIFDNIFYFSCKSTRKCIKNILNGKNTKIIFKTIFVLETENKYLSILRYIISMLVDIFYLIKLPKNVPIVYCYNNMFSSPVLNVLNKILNKNIVIFCHGELELLNRNFLDHPGIFAKLIQKKIYSFFLNKNTTIVDKLIFVVLGNSILFNLNQILPYNIIKYFYTIDHPFISNDLNIIYRQHKKLNFGTVGVVSKGKNIEQFIYLAKQFLPEIKEKKISFSAIGAINYKRRDLLEAYIDIPNNNNLIGRASFNERISNLDYILFFYHSDSYKYLASGAVLDAINMEIPIIAIKNDYFEYLFSRFGLFGYLVDSIDDMENIIREILAGKKMKLFSFEKIKENLSPLAVSRQFKINLERAGLL
jgi:hypothetical protein